MDKNKPKAVAYPLEKTGWKNPCSYQNSSKSVVKSSGYKADYRKHVDDYAGKQKKKLVPYDPNAARSRIAVPYVKMPHETFN